MIRINLIPGPRGKAAKGQWDIRFELAGAVGLVVLALGACVVWSSILNSEIQAMKMEKQLRRLKEKRTDHKGHGADKRDVDGGDEESGEETYDEVVRRTMRE